MNKKYFLLISLLSFNSYGFTAIDCGKQEKQVFSCDFESKRVSVCANDNQLIYRFGTDKKIELELESPVHYSETGYSGGWESNLTFSNGEYKYVAYQKLITVVIHENGIREKEESTGIYIVKNKKIIATLDCGLVDWANLPPYKVEEFEHYYSD